MKLQGLVDFIKKNLPSESCAYNVEKIQNRKFEVVSDNFIISTSGRDGYVRIVRDIRMQGNPKVDEEVNYCRVLYLYESLKNDIFHYKLKYIFE